MIKQYTVFEVHRLKHEKLSNRKIAKQLGIHRDTVSKYLNNPDLTRKSRITKSTKLDKYRDQIDQMLSDCPEVNAVIVLQKIKEAGFDGEISIVRQYLRKKRGKVKTRQPFIRFESEPGQQMQVDWGHFGSIEYGKSVRKLYGLVVVEAYSRMMYVEFTHTQKQEILHQCLYNAFRFLGGTPKELVVDNMTTAVIERHGKIVRFNDQFLSFLRPLKIIPQACNVRAPYEKGKVERSIGYLRKSFFPLRNFEGLEDAQEQVLNWLSKIANKRIHQTTGDVPEIRAGHLQMKQLPYEIRTPFVETQMVKVYKDFSVRFDSNSYTVPHRCIGKHLTLKANQKTVWIFDKSLPIVTHTRCWEKKQRLEIQSHVEDAKRQRRKELESNEVSIFKSLGEEFREFLIKLTHSNQPVQKSLERILYLKDQYGKGSLAWAIQKALRHNAIGADYIENILYQEMTPQTDHPPVITKKDHLNNIRLCEPSLAEYDAFILKRRQ